MSAHLAIVLPGRAYGPHGPAMHVPLLALRQCGAAVAAVQYPGNDGGFDRSVAEQVAASVAQHQPARVTFVAKSIGTVALAHLDPAIVDAPVVDAIWLTPIFRLADVRDGAMAKGWRALLVAGDADSEHAPEHHDAVRAALGADSLVLPDADHSLEVDGDVAATLERWASLAEAVLAFAGR
jgi:hypothetical protein